MIKVKIYVGDAYDIPEYQTDGAAGMDLYANNDDPILIHPGDRKLIPTGIRLQIPEGFEAQIRPRSGLVLRHGITVLNTPGTVDSDYRGTIGVILQNASSERFFVNRGDRIAQMVFKKYERADLVEVSTIEELDDSARGEGGFGSTGNK
jgi:dUTP pyrophosphatase